MISKLVSNYAGFLHRCDKDNSKHEYSWKYRLSEMNERYQLLGNLDIDRYRGVILIYRNNSL